MRVLVGAVGSPGHLFPLLPLASALRDEGRDVAVATAQEMAATAAAARLPLVPAGLGIGQAFARASADLGLARPPEDPEVLRAAVAGLASLDRKKDSTPIGCCSPLVPSPRTSSPASSRPAGCRSSPACREPSSWAASTSSCTTAAARDDPRRRGRRRAAGPAAVGRRPVRERRGARGGGRVADRARAPTR